MADKPSTATTQRSQNVVTADQQLSKAQNLIGKRIANGTITPQTFKQAADAYGKYVKASTARKTG